MSFFGVIGPTLAIHGSIHHQLTSWFFVTNTHTPRLFCGFNSTPQSGDCSPIEREISTPSPGQWPAVPIDIYDNYIWTIWFTRLPSQFVQQTSWIPSISIFILVIPWFSCLNISFCYRNSLPSFCGTFVGSTIVCWIKSSCLLLWSHFCWIVIEKQL